MQSAVPNVSQVMTKNKTFPLNQSLACANYAINVALYACKGYAKKAVKIGNVMMRSKNHRMQDP